MFLATCVVVSLLNYIPILGTVVSVAMTAFMLSPIILMPSILAELRSERRTKLERVILYPLYAAYVYWMLCPIGFDIDSYGVVGFGILFVVFVTPVTIGWLRLIGFKLSDLHFPRFVSQPENS